jgi:hypothetical protein
MSTGNGDEVPGGVITLADLVEFETKMAVEAETGTNGAPGPDLEWELLWELLRRNRSVYGSNRDPSDLVAEMMYFFYKPG